MATATGAIRLLNNRHWLSDVAVGAGIGILSTRVTYLICPWLRRQVGLETGASLGVLPFYPSGAIGLMGVYVL